MNILLMILGIACVWLGGLYLRLCGDIRSLSGQLGEIGRGSHMELAVNSRQKSLLTLCQVLNRVLAAKDADHIRCERAEKLLKQNITSLAHDIRTPLMGASGYIQLAGECEDSGKLEHYLEAAGKRMAELEDMLEEMFLYTKLSSEDFSLSSTDIQVLPLLGECLLGLYSRFEELGISPEVSFESEGFCVAADEEALRRVFLNLIQNALVHGTGGMIITQKGNSLSFENPVAEGNVPDPGQMFERFYKADTARRKGSSGLGLYIVRELMRKMGGEVKAQLEEGMLKVVLCFGTDDKDAPRKK